MQTGHRKRLRTLLTEEQCHMAGLRQKTPNRNNSGAAEVLRMRAKNCERVPVVTVDELFKLIERQVRHVIPQYISRIVWGLRLEWKGKISSRMLKSRFSQPPSPGAPR